MNVLVKYEIQFWFQLRIHHCEDEKEDKFYCGYLYIYCVL